MTSDQRIDAINSSQRYGRVFHAVFMIRRADAGMRERNDDIGALFFYFRYIGLGSLNNIARSYIALKMDEVTRMRMSTHPAEFDMYYSM